MRKRRPTDARFFIAAQYLCHVTVDLLEPELNLPITLDPPAVDTRTAAARQTTALAPFKRIARPARGLQALEPTRKPLIKGQEVGGYRHRQGKTDLGHFGLKGRVST
jgi:hypothetical protein